MDGGDGERFCGDGSEKEVTQNCKYFHLQLNGLMHSGVLFMVALCNRADHYIFILFLLSSSFFFLFFFPRLISAVGDWMFTILWHMVWP